MLPRETLNTTELRKIYNCHEIDAYDFSVTRAARPDRTPCSTRALEAQPRASLYRSDPIHRGSASCCDDDIEFSDAFSGDSDGVVSDGVGGSCAIACAQDYVAACEQLATRNDELLTRNMELQRAKTTLHLAGVGLTAENRTLREANATLELANQRP